MTRLPNWMLLGAWAILCAMPVAHAQEINIPRPGDRDFIADTAGLLKPEDTENIRAIGDKLLTENAIPITVVTISSMADHGFPKWRIETFARTLFDQWGIGHEQVEGTPWDRGILLLVSHGDRKARIELGADWARDNDEMANQIMQEQMVPYFRGGDYSGGILAGVKALDKMARGVPFQGGQQGSPGARHQGGAAGGAAPGIGGAIGGCAAGLGQMIMFPFIAIAALFSRLFGGGHRGGGGGFNGGGGFSGGSFGGGHSGGGGATGSW